MSVLSTNAAQWPALPWREWAETADTLHIWTQIVGKTRLELTPLQNHWWNVPLYVTAHGLGYIGDALRRRCTGYRVRFCHARASLPNGLRAGAGDAAASADGSGFL